MISTKQSEAIFAALKVFQIELPSWGFANTGTRFGKFIQPAAATTLEEKLSDAAQVHH
jgi:Predicted sugar isomerase